MSATPALVAIEGPCCAGKTTLADGLERSWAPARVVVVPDYADFAGGAAGMPTPDPLDEAEESLALAALLELEAVRFETHPQPMGSTEPMFVDRSVLTLTAHCQGLDERGEGRFQFLPQGTRTVHQDPRSRFPSHVIYLDVRFEIQRARNRGKFADDSVFMDERYNAGFRDYFQAFALGRPSTTVWIDGNAEPGRVLEGALAFLVAQGLGPG